MSIFGFFPQEQKSVFRRIFCGCRNFDHEIFRKKLMSLVDIHNKYLKLTLITYENIQKVNRVTFFSTSQYSISKWRKKSKFFEIFSCKKYIFSAFKCRFNHAFLISRSGEPPFSNLVNFVKIRKIIKFHKIIIFSIFRCFSSKNEQKCRFLKIKKFISMLDIFMTYDRNVPNDTAF